MPTFMGCVADAGVFWSACVVAILCGAAGVAFGVGMGSRRVVAHRRAGAETTQGLVEEPAPLRVRAAPVAAAEGAHPHIDPLTGVASRLLLRDRLDVAVAMADRSESGVAVLWIDLDRFHAVNDEFGRAVGDRLLIEVAKRLRGAIRDTDTVARLENDAFVVVQPFAAQPQSAQALSHRLIRMLAEPHVIDGHIVVSPASVGIAFCPTDATNSEMLLKHADLALRRAKRGGGNGVRFYNEALDVSLRARFTLTQDLRHALERGEMALHYQPMLDADRLDTMGFEALLRWTHRDQGVIPPSTFMPLAEQCGVMPSLGIWALDAACADAVTWPSSRLLAVNLSRSELRHRDLPARILETLSRHGFPPERLELEIQESVLVDDEDRTLDVLTKLKTRGMRVTLDGFGTARASLLTLRRFAFNRVKLDRKLIASLGQDEGTGLTVRAILAMARTLDLDVTAGGVETDHQLSLLRTFRCDHVQGFLLARPAPAAQLSHAPRLSVVAA